MAEEDEKKKPAPPVPPGFTSRPSSLVSAPRPPGAAPAAPSAPMPPRPMMGAGAPSGMVSRPPSAALGQMPPAQRPVMGAGAPPAPPPRPYGAQPSAGMPLGGGAAAPNLPTILSGIALLLSVIALVMVLLGAGGGLSKTDAKAIAEDLKKIGDKEITLSSPITTTISIDRAFDAKDAFPATLSLPIDFAIPLDTKVVGLSPTGQPIQFTIKDQSIPLKGTVTLDLAKAATGKQITIRKDIPVSGQIVAKVTIKDLYGDEYNSIISRLEK